MHFEKSISGVFVSIFLLSIAAGFGAAALIDILLLAKVRHSSNKPVLNFNYTVSTGVQGFFSMLTYTNSVILNPFSAIIITILSKFINLPYTGYSKFTRPEETSRFAAKI